jgi:thiol-disulfide isomerase/thioredoxin
MRKVNVLLSLLLLSQAISAQPPVTVQGQPFGGRVQGPLSDPWIEMEALAHRAGWARHPAYSGWCYREHDEGEICPSKDLIGKGQTFLQGERVESRTFEGVTMVSLQAVKRLFGLEATLTSSGWDLKLEPPAPANPVLPTQPPGSAACSLENSLRPSKIHVALFFTQWCPSCWKYFPTLERLARSHPDVELVEMDIGEFGSPMCQQYGIRATPWVRLLDDQGQTLADGSAAESWLKERFGVSMPTPLKCVGAPGK